MAMRRVTLRFSETLWELVEAEATRDGISGSAWLREAALLRVGFRQGARGEYASVQEAVEALLEQAREP